jgi:hypothetical protein
MSLLTAFLIELVNTGYYAGRFFCLKLDTRPNGACVRRILFKKAVDFACIEGIKQKYTLYVMPH